jgi:uncharacterized protein
VGLTEPKIYLDSCVAIYLVEEHSVFAPAIEFLLESRPNAEIFISDLTVMECLVGPLRAGNQTLESKYRQWFESVVVFPVTREVFTEAARLRADFPSLKTPDALHVATAFHHRCDELWTNDERLSALGLNIIRNISSS